MARVRSRQVREIQQSTLFDRRWYLEHNPDVAASGEDAIRHFLHSGAAEGRSPGPDFDVAYYLATNPDLARTGENPLLHYLRRGKAEGRDTTSLAAQRRRLSASPLFDPIWYRTRYPDVAASGIDPALHYLTSGGREGRAAGPDFDSAAYLEHYPDVAASGVNPLLHYLESGEAEGRDPNPRDADLRLIRASPLFDGRWYLERYADVAVSGLDPAEHYQLWGAAERRSPGPNFDAGWYAYANRDLPPETNALLHYLKFGKDEGRPIRAVASYADWVREFDTLDRADIEAIRDRAERLPGTPLISVLVPVYNPDEDHLREMIESVLRQLYRHWELCIADDASSLPHVRRVLDDYRRQDARIKVVFRDENGHISAASNSALALATGEFVALLDHDDVLPPHALFMVAHAITRSPDSDVFYSDEDKLDARGQREDPYFKPDWNPDLLYSQNCISHLGVYRTALVRQLGGFRLGYEGSQDYDLALRATGATRHPIVHIPHVLYHWRKHPGATTFSSRHFDRATDAARRAIADFLTSRGERATVSAAVGGFHRVVRQPAGDWPLVTAIVPTRDRHDLLARCVSGLLDATDYPHLEVIVADNDSSAEETRTLFDALQHRGVRIVSCPGPFNYSRINNRAVREANGEVLLFLNNDTAVIEPSWLKEMVSHVLAPGAGAVGARLLYPDGRVQHAGVLLGFDGIAGHMYRGAPHDDPGYHGRLKLIQGVSCVTAACMVVPKAVFDALGGFDEVHLAVNFNDVDLCNRIRESGRRIVWTPYAELIHAESASRGRELRPGDELTARQEVEYLQHRWGPWLVDDPCFNPNLSLTSLRPEPAFPPRARKPWRSARDPRAVRPALTRAELLLEDLEPSTRIIEIGASYSPIAPKAAGWHTRTLDHAPRAALVDKYRGAPDVDVERIEEVDFVWTRGPMISAVPPAFHGSFDALIASHVIEHTTDLIGFLDAAATLLARTGVVILAVPDKRYCFDYFRPFTTTGAVLAAHRAHRARHTDQAVFDHRAYAALNNGTGAWGQSPVGTITFAASLEQAASDSAKAREGEDSEYIDVHAWQFCPASFELMLLEIARLGETDWQIDRISPTTGCEFYVWLRRGGLAAAAALSNEQLVARRMALLKQVLREEAEQINFMLLGEAGEEAEDSRMRAGMTPEATLET